jgi:hypothetical protein
VGGRIGRNPSARSAAIPVFTVVPHHRLPRVYALQQITVVAASGLGVFAVAAAIDATSAAPVIAAASAWMLLTGILTAARTAFPRN